VTRIADIVNERRGIPPTRRCALRAISKRTCILDESQTRYDLECRDEMRQGVRRQPLKRHAPEA